MTGLINMQRAPSPTPDVRPNWPAFAPPLTFNVTNRRAKCLQFKIKFTSANRVIGNTAVLVTSKPAPAP